MNIWIVLIICITFFCCVSEIADIFKAKYKKEKFKFTDETGYILISEIIKAHTSEHNQDREVMQRCEQALQILNMMKED